VLMQNHGPFTIGTNAKDAVKAAVMVEDVARTVHLAREAGPLIAIPQESIDRLFDRYQNVYGQAVDARRSGEPAVVLLSDDAESSIESEAESANHAASPSQATAPKQKEATAR
jgi:hypothetical protein